MASETQSESSSGWTSKQSDRIGELLQSALEREPGERVTFLRGACADDEPLLREVQSLLSSSEKAGDFIERPELNVPAMTVALQLRDGGAGLKPGTAIGRYRIVRRIGEGGMGAVYEAEQENPRRTVALKFINQRLVSPDQLRRFERESQALGRLQHPGIAQIYEAGTAQFGYGPEPYFAMEFIRGETLREYADKHRLSTRERLEMITRICDAVRHAHQRGLIHRDLKPDNILVDDSGQPKVLDFGVARMTDGDTKATLSRTVVGQLLGTLPYMSPEQALADPLEVDTRSDVYALGVILYELLSARLPYTLSEKIHEALQTIREQDPARLSSINREYRGDIETIVAKALEKDKRRRYASASELAADIRRYLRDEPIMARPPSAAYQLQKFARRNKALVTGIAVAFFALSAGVVTTSWMAIGIQKELNLRRIAEGQARAEVARALVAEENARVAEQGAAVRERQAMDLARRAAVARDAAQADLLMSQGRYEDAQRLYASMLAADRILSIVVDHEIHWPKFSPDGRWIAFQSRAGDRNEIYVHGPVDPPQILQTSKPVSADGGQCVRWSDDGKELLYVAPSGALLAVPMDFASDGQSFKTGKPRALTTPSSIGNADNSAQQCVVSDHG